MLELETANHAALLALLPSSLCPQEGFPLSNLSIKKYRLSNWPFSGSADTSQNLTSAVFLPPQMWPWRTMGRGRTWTGHLVIHFTWKETWSEGQFSTLSLSVSRSFEGLTWWWWYEGNPTLGWTNSASRIQGWSDSHHRWVLNLQTTGNYSQPPTGQNLLRVSASLLVLGGS